MSTPTVNEHEEHIVQPKTYLLILMVLLVLTAVTTGVAFLDLGILNPIVALAIACVKATLVVLFFMHLRWSSKLLKLTLCSGLFAFLVLITMTLTDYISRAWGLW
jgi:cytochrome c oxidase subunit IV